LSYWYFCILRFFFQAEDGIRDRNVTGVQTCALPIYVLRHDESGLFNNLASFSHGFSLKYVMIFMLVLISNKGVLPCEQTLLVDYFIIYCSTSVICCYSFYYLCNNRQSRCFVGCVCQCDRVFTCSCWFLAYFKKEFTRRKTIPSASTWKNNWLDSVRYCTGVGSATYCNFD